MLASQIKIVSQWPATKYVYLPGTNAGNLLVEHKDTEQRKAIGEIQREWIFLPKSFTSLGFHQLLGNQKHSQDMQLLCVDPLLSWFPVRYCSKRIPCSKILMPKKSTGSDGNAAKSALSTIPLGFHFPTSHSISKLSPNEEPLPKCLQIFKWRNQL